MHIFAVIYTIAYYSNNESMDSPYRSTREPINIPKNIPMKISDG